MRKLFRRHKELKIDEHDYGGWEEYEMFPMKIKKRIFVSFFMYDNDGKKPHCHVRVWKKGKGYKKELYHLAIRLDKPEFHHVDELGMLDNKEYLKSIARLFSMKLEIYGTGKYELVWDFLWMAWNFPSASKTVKVPKEMPDYTKLYDNIN